MKITILSPNLSGNELGRAYILAKVLGRRWDVEIVGPMFGRGLWYPLSDDKTIQYNYVKIKNKRINIKQIFQLFKKITGDVIYATKPLATSFGIGLLNKFIRGKPLILDIDDWEVGLSKEFYIKLSLMGKVKNFICSPINPFSYWNIVFWEKMVFFSNGITVSNSFLQDKFGGICIHHGRDIKHFNPKCVDREKIRKIFHLQDKKVISFIGSMRAHKGLGDFVEAVSRINNSNVVLALVGVSEYEKNFCSWAEEKLGKKRIILIGQQPMSKLREFLAMSDIIVVPQKDNWATRGQFPAKIFDAMAMAKPIVSTKVNDIARVLDGCGIIVNPGNIEEITSKINLLLEDEVLRLKLGKKAREMCIKKYSWDVMERKLFTLFNKYARRKSPAFIKSVRAFCKKILLALCYYLGIYEIIRIIFSKKKFVPILLYHQIFDKRETLTGEASFCLLGTGISKSQFMKQLNYLKKNYNVISLKDYLEKKGKAENLNGYAVITFDDGFKNSGFDILKNFHLPATVFITGNYFKEVGWRHKICLLLDYAKAKDFSIDLGTDKKLFFSLASNEKKQNALFALLRNLNDIPPERRNAIITKLSEDLMVEKEFKAHELYLDENDMEKMIKDGVSFGAHSITHPNLTMLDDKALQMEVESSKELLMRLTGEKDIPFAIPYGFYNKRVVEFVRKRFSCNLTSDEGLNSTQQNIYSLKRIFVNTHSFYEFVFKISGTQMLYWHWLEFFSQFFAQRDQHKDD